METDEWVNEVRLVGRVSGAVDERELPSGDFVAALRLVVPRAPGASRGAATVDTIDVACWTGRTRQSARRLAAGDQIEVVGALRRRFFRAGASSASRYEVEARKLTRVRRPPGQGAGSGGGVAASPARSMGKREGRMTRSGDDQQPRG